MWKLIETVKNSKIGLIENATAQKTDFVENQRAAFALFFKFSRFVGDLFRFIIRGCREGATVVFLSFTLISIVNLSFLHLLQGKWTLSGATGDGMLLQLFHVNFQASHEFLIHRDQYEAKRGGVAGFNTAVY